MWHCKTLENIERYHTRYKYLLHGIIVYDGCAEVGVGWNAPGEPPHFDTVGLYDHELVSTVNNEHGRSVPATRRTADRGDAVVVEMGESQKHPELHSGVSEPTEVLEFLFQVWPALDRIILGKVNVRVDVLRTKLNRFRVGV